MARKSRKNNRDRNPIRSCFTTLLTGVAVIIAVILTNATGIDFIGLIGGGGSNNPTPPTATQSISATAPPSTGNVTTIPVGQGFGARKGFWQVYFTNPSGSTDRSTYINGIDYELAKAIDSVQRTLDIAAFEWNSPILTQAVINARRRGVAVRMVADNEHTLEDEDSTIGQLLTTRIPVVYDERSAFMHNKFMILDGSVVWTGSTNFTINDVYRNNNNLIMLRSRNAVEVYQAEFNEMYETKSFGPRSPANNTANYTQDGIPIQILFAPENRVIDTIMNEVNQAQRNIRFMAFSFTHTDLGKTLENRAKQGVQVEGVFETRGSETEFSELRHLFCLGLDVRQDGNNFTMHHKVFIIDTSTVITGSFNFSDNAVRSNDENLLVIKDRDLVAQYLAEYERVKTRSRRPSGLAC